MCSDPSTGNAGKRCISDRQAGSCAYHQTADKVPPWGTPAAGECWNWDSGYRRPIAEDPNVVDDSVLSTSTAAAMADQAASSLGLSTPALIGVAALAALGIWAVAS
jgi:hypothetical protein